jgi:hypothetical protein
MHAHIFELLTQVTGQQCAAGQSTHIAAIDAYGCRCIEWQKVLQLQAGALRSILQVSAPGNEAAVAVDESAAPAGSRGLAVVD